MRASRLLSILMLLQTRGRVTADVLAREVEVSVRTVYRDVDQLSAAGVPVYADRGPGGGFQLLDGYRTRLTGLTVDEAQTLFLAGLPGPAAELGLGPAMAAARLKLLAALPAGGSDAARGVASRFHLDPVAWFRGAEPVGLVAQIAEAVWTSRRLQIRYRRSKGPVDRLVDPLGLVLKAGVWYLVAAVDGSIRTYRVGAVLEASIREEQFQPPDGFDLAEVWDRYARRYEADLLRGTAVVRVSARGLRRLPLLGAAVVQAVAEAGHSPDPDGWTRLEIPVESPEEAASALLCLGADLEVIGPPDLRRRIAKEATHLARVYAGQNPAA